MPSKRLNRCLLALALAATQPISVQAADAGTASEAEAYAAAVLGDECDRNGMTDIPVNQDEPESFSHYIYPLTDRHAYQQADEPDRKATLFQIFCGSGAYNIRSAFVLKLQDEAGFKLVGFPQPAVRIEYEDSEQTRLKASPVVTGFISRFLLVNPKFEPETATVKSHTLWRGLGDAWDAGEWRLEDGDFALKRFEIDPTFDGGENQEAPGSHVVFQAP